MFKRLWIYLLVLVITVYLGVAYLESFPTILVGVELMFGLCSVAYVWLSTWGLKVGVVPLSDTMTVGKKGLLRARIKNQSIFPVFYGELFLELTYLQSNQVLKLRLPFAAMPEKNQVLRLPMTLQYAGTLRIAVKYLVVYDFLHLFGIKKKLRVRPMTVTILPEFQQMLVVDRSSRFQTALIEERALQEGDDKIRMQQFYKDRVGDDPSEVFQVRDYQIGDKPSRVDWKLSAKAGSLMVKDYSFPIIDKTVIFVDLHCERQLQYHQRIHMAVALCVSALELHCAVTLAWFDKTSQCVVQRHLEQDEDLFESVGMLAAAVYCRTLSPEDTLQRLHMTCQLEQLIYITGGVAQETLLTMEGLDLAKRIWIYAIDQKNVGFTAASEKVRCHVLDSDHLEQELDQIQLELY